MNPRGAVVLPLTPLRITGSFAPIATLADYDEWLAGVGLDPKTIRLYTKAVTRVISWCARAGHHFGAGFPHPNGGVCAVHPTLELARRQLRSALGHWWRMTNRPEPPLGGGEGTPQTTGPLPRPR